MIMKASDFKRWRKGLGLSQKEAADVLGLKRRMIQYYEKGQRNGKKVGVPKTVRLACYAIADGVDDYGGPPRPRKKTKAVATKRKGVSRRGAARRQSPKGEDIPIP